MEKDNKDYDLNEMSRKLHEDAKTKEVIFCPKCGNKLIVQRSKDWSRLYAVYCPKCEFGMKVSYSLEKGSGL